MALVNLRMLVNIIYIVHSQMTEQGLTRWAVRTAQPDQLGAIASPTFHTPATDVTAVSKARLTKAQAFTLGDLR